MMGLDLRTLVGLTLRNPAHAGHAILAAGMPISQRWAFAALIIALSSALTGAMTMLAPNPAPENVEQIVLAWFGRNPLFLAGFQLTMLAVLSLLAAEVGRMFGGHGRFEDALILAAWVETLLLLLQVLQVVLLPVSPEIVSMLGLAGVGMSIYLTVQFIKVMHGFQNGWKVLFVMIGTMLALGFVLSFVAAAFGLLPEVPA